MPGTAGQAKLLPEFRQDSRKKYDVISCFCMPWLTLVFFHAFSMQCASGPRRVLVDVLPFAEMFSDLAGPLGPLYSMNFKDKIFML